MSLKKDKVALFDLDGTLFDTSMVNYHSYKDALNQFGYDLSYDFYLKEFYGKVYSHFLPLIIGQNNPDLKNIHSLKKELYPKKLIFAQKNEFLFDIITALKPSYHTGIVTTASRKNTTEILDYFKVRELFDLIITQEDVQESKPSPEGYLKAMNFFNVSSENTIIYEDSEVGLQAAKASGARILKVEYPLRF